jgi:hypothetical protein
VDAIAELFRQRFVHHAVALDPAFAREARRNDLHAEVGLTARTGAGVADMEMRLVEDDKFLRMQNPGEDIFDAGFH